MSIHFGKKFSLKRVNKCFSEWYFVSSALTLCTEGESLLAAGKDIKRLLLTPGNGEASSGASGDEDGGDDAGAIPQGSNSSAALEDVLVISLGVSSDCPGMLQEQKVSHYGQNRSYASISHSCLSHMPNFNVNLVCKFFWLYGEVLNVTCMLLGLPDTVHTNENSAVA